MALTLLTLLQLIMFFLWNIFFRPITSRRRPHGRSQPEMLHNYIEISFAGFAGDFIDELLMFEFLFCWCCNISVSLRPANLEENQLLPECLHRLDMAAQWRTQQGKTVGLGTVQNLGQQAKTWFSIFRTLFQKFRIMLYKNLNMTSRKLFHWWPNKHQSSRQT